MNSVILCEGETDVIILSKYLICQYGFQFTSQPLLDIEQLNKKNTSEVMYNYKNADNQLLIWAVGGKGKFNLALDKILSINKLNANIIYHQVVIFSDNDSHKEVQKQKQKFCEIISKYEFQDKPRMSNIEIGEWYTGKMKTKMSGRYIDIKFLLLSIPSGENGALETMLLNSFEGEVDKILATKAENFVHDLVNNDDKITSLYLQSRRDIIKAPLAVFFAIAAPDRVYVKQNKIFESVDWGKFATIHNELQMLDVFACKNSKYTNFIEQEQTS